MHELNKKASTVLPSVSLCTPTTLSHLLFKERRSIQNEKTISNGKPTNSSKIKVFTECMEFGESSFIEKIYSNKSETYENFSKKFKNSVIDKNGDHILATEEEENGEKVLEKEEARQKFIRSYSSKKEFDKKTEKRMKEMNEENKKVSYLIKENNSGSMTNLKSMVYNVNKSTMSNVLENLLEKSKQEIIKHYELKFHTMENENYVMQERLLKEKNVLLDENKKVKLNLEEFRESNECLKRKNALLKENFTNLKVNLENQMKMNTELEDLQQNLKLLKEKFPSVTLDKLIQKYELLEKTLTELLRKVGELEADKIQLTKDKNEEASNFKEKYQVVQETEKKREKEFQKIKSQLNMQNMDLQDSFKEKYFSLFKKIISLYNKWKKELKIFRELELNPNDPEEIIDYIDKGIQISSNERLHNYLRKIIASANHLQRQHFPENLNEKFDPEKFYERVNRKLSLMKSDKKKKEIPTELL